MIGLIVLVRCRHDVLAMALLTRPVVGDGHGHHSPDRRGGASMSTASTFWGQCVPIQSVKKSGDMKPRVQGEDSDSCN